MKPGHNYYSNRSLKGINFVFRKGCIKLTEKNELGCTTVFKIDIRMIIGNDDNNNVS